MSQHLSGKASTRCRVRRIASMHAQQEHIRTVYCSRISSPVQARHAAYTHVPTLTCRVQHRHDDRPAAQHPAHLVRQVVHGQVELVADQAGRLLACAS